MLTNTNVNVNNLNQKISVKIILQCRNLDFDELRDQLKLT